MVLPFLGFGQLDMSIEGPRRSRVDMECYDNEDGTCRAIYKPTHPGQYVINIKFGDDHITGNVAYIPQYNISLLRNDDIIEWKPL